jgi:lipoprotein NlpI
VSIFLSTVILNAPVMAVDNNNKIQAAMFIDRGIQSFRQLDTQSSVDYFNKAIQLYPKYKSILWQRGLSLYYNKEFVECSQQFRDDVALNPLDTEEAIWTFMCESNIPGGGGIEMATRDMIQLPGEDRRPIMRTIYKAFKDYSTIGDLEAFAEAENGRSSSDFFYANLYLALLKDVRGDANDSKKYLERALSSAYANKSNDYMIAVARSQRSRY